MKQEKPIAVYGAIAANLAIAAMKFVVSFITGSSAMFAEAIPSTADTGNELLLLLGLKRSKSQQMTCIRWATDANSTAGILS